MTKRIAKMARIAAVGSVLSLGVAAPLLAQDAARDATTYDRRGDDPDHGYWGLFGLVGLAGLAGLTKRERERERDVRYPEKTATSRP